MIHIKHNKTNKKTNWENILFGCELLNIPVEEDPKLTQEYAQTCQGKDGLQLLEVYIDDKKKRVWLDNGNFTYRFYPEVLAGNDDLYFKITLTEEHKAHYPNRIFPYAESMYRPRDFYNNRERLRKLVNSKNYKWDVGGLFRCYDKGNRKECIKKLLDANKWNMRVGTCGKGIRLPATISDNWKIPLEEQWEFEAQTKINLGLRGCGYWDFRTTIGWGIGACIMMFPEKDMIEFPHDKSIYISGKLDYSDLVEKIDYYLEYEEVRWTVAYNGYQYYNKYFTPEATVNWILDRVKERI